jgi:hypothetical protein
MSDSSNDLYPHPLPAKKSESTRQIDGVPVVFDAKAEADKCIAMLDAWWARNGHLIEEQDSKATIFNSEF